MTTHHSDLRYSFGANWSSYVATAFTPERLKQAAQSIQQMLRVENLQGQVFLDVGCGSGLFSWAACALGARRVVAFDYDPQSVATSQKLRAQAGITETQCQITQGSILDSAFLQRLEPADVVYAWGVLHHTGAMWTAIDNAASLVKPGGQLAIAIYNRVDRFGDSSVMWSKIKHLYTRSPQTVRRSMECAWQARQMLGRVVRRHNPFKAPSGSTPRGMDMRHDMRDWLGGFPYEYATAGEVFGYLHEKSGLQLEYLKTNDGNLCNQFTFRRPLVG